MSETVFSQQAQEYWYNKLKNVAVDSLSVADLASTEVASVTHYFYRIINTHLESKFTSVTERNSINEFIVGVTALAAMHYKYELNHFVITTVSSIADIIKDKPLFFRLNAIQEESFKDLIGQVREQFGEGIQFQDYDYSRLLAALEANKSAVSEKLHEMGFGYDNGNDIRTDMAAAKPFRIFFLLMRQQDTLTLRVQYDSVFFSQEVIEQLGSHYLAVMEQLLCQVNSSIRAFSMLSSWEKHQQIVDFNNTCQDFPRIQSITQAFEEWAGLDAEAPAVRTENAFLSYGQLNAQANQLAHHLRDVLGVKKGDLVAVMLERSEDLIIGLLATLKAGAAYVPIDPSYPRERISYILSDCGANVLITESGAMWTILDNYTGSIFAIDIQMAELASPAGNLPIAGSPDELVYVIYTSGSTGTPKGVMVEHQSLINLCCWHKQAFQVQSSSKATVYAGVGFDASAWEIWPYLISGASLYMIKDQLRHGVGELVDLLETAQITHSFLPTKLCEQLLELHPQPLNEHLWILTGGDAFRGIADTAWKVINNYGPTEFTVVATSGPVSAGKSGRVVPIGKPIANSKAYILDNSLSLLPLGVPGELYLSGAGMARGYLNQPGLTADRFVPGPFDDALLYKTGDICRWLPNGTIEFLGRRDNQVKIRGYRIELGEIEQVLLKHEAVKDAIVAARQGERDTSLVAYVTTNKSVQGSLIREYLKSYLPIYMLPAHVVLLDSFPVNANGKIDRSKLPDPDKLGNQTVYRSPGNEQELKLTELWEQVLGKAQVGVDDNFFAVGGDSIKAIQIISRLHSIGYKLEVKDIFRYPTIANLAPKMMVANLSANQELIMGDVPLTPIQKAFFRAIGTDRNHYKIGRAHV